MKANIEHNDEATGFHALWIHERRTPCVFDVWNAAGYFFV